jgi:hypothetical protein
MDADGQHQPVGEPHRAAPDVEVAQRDGIERSGKERDARHAAGLACGARRRKAPLGAAVRRAGDSEDYYVESISYVITLTSISDRK